MNKEAKRRLLDGLNACRAIGQFVVGRTFEEYERNLMLRSAVERQFEILGESLHHAEIADETVLAEVTDLRMIVGLRNRIVHGYDTVDDEILWRLLHDELPRLVQQLEAALK